MGLLLALTAALTMCCIWHAPVIVLAPQADDLKIDASVPDDEFLCVGYFAPADLILSRCIQVRELRSLMKWHEAN